MKKPFNIAKPFDLGNRLAIVTGAGSGLGRHFASVLVAAGARVALCGRRMAPLEETAELIGAGGGRALCLAMDITDEASVKRALDAICTQSGVPDILVNNAGTNKPTFATELTMEEWDQVVDTNLRGCFMLARMFASRLIGAGKGGSIVNVASVLGLRAQKAVAAYMASKAGLIHLTRGLALEWANYGIRVNALAPGWFRTDLTVDFLDTPPGQKLVGNIPLKRAGNLIELSAPLLLLASDAGSFMTGSVLVVDGGHVVSSL
jgi:NAD(P)-dependent dehydrogenase (short-subunit alcohol dehydrogenase family)